jgi:hypothetical protein
MNRHLISYPITQQVREARLRFRRINDAVAIPTAGRSELEIVRLLGNVHYAHIEQLLELIDKTLAVSGCIGKSLLEQTNPFQFGSRLAELFLFCHLREYLGDKVHPSITGPSEKGPDIEIPWNDLLVRIEIYSPIDLMGFQSLEKHFTPLCKYLPVSKGFALEIGVDPIDQSERGVWYPYSIPTEQDVISWLRDTGAGMHKWLSSSIPSDHYSFKGPGENIVIDVTLKDVVNDPTDRRIGFTPRTRSTDSRLLFECGNAESTANSGWGQKLKEKLARRQGGPPASDVLRILCVDFARGDTGFPDFICWPKIAERISETVTLLVARISGATPYDILVPARLDLNCCFGSPIWIEPTNKPRAGEFIPTAGLDRPCVYEAPDQRSLMEELSKTYTENIQSRLAHSEK